MTMTQLKHQYQQEEEQHGQKIVMDRSSFPQRISINNKPPSPPPPVLSSSNVQQQLLLSKPQSVTRTNRAVSLPTNVRRTMSHMKTSRRLFWFLPSTAKTKTKTNMIETTNNTKIESSLTPSDNSIEENGSLMMKMIMTTNTNEFSNKLGAFNQKDTGVDEDTDDISGCTGRDDDDDNDDEIDEESLLGLEFVLSRHDKSGIEY